MLRTPAVMMIVAVAFAAVLCTQASAVTGGRVVSETVWYQGFLADVDTGEPIDGAVTLVASLYDQAAGGTMVWGEETHAATTVTEGWFNIELGATVPLGAFDAPPYYLQLTVDGELLEPRLKLASVPMALKSAKADSASQGGDASPWTEAGANVYRAGGNVGIGTVSPIEDLHIVKDQNGITGIIIENTDTGGSSMERIVFENEDGGLAFVQLYDDDHFAYPGRMAVSNNRPGGSLLLGVGGTGVFVDTTGYVGVGTLAPAARLDVDGSARVEGFEMGTGAADGYVLTSDASGVGSWEAPAAGGGTILVDVHSETTPTTIGTSVTQFDDTQVTLTVPGAGYILCTSTVRVTLNHANNSVSDHLMLNHSETPSSIGESSTLVSHWVLPTEPIGPVYRSYSIHSAHPVYVAGTYTYYLVGRMGSGGDASDEFVNAQMTAVYYPD